MENCVFCKIVKGEIPCDKIYEDDNFIGILDIKPLSNGHTLIVSKKHFKTLFDMPSSLGVEYLDAIKHVSLKLIKQGKAEGFNFVINNGEVGGQLVRHFHCHVIPRNSNDGLRMYRFGDV